MPNIRHPVAIKSETDTSFTLEGWAVVFDGEDLQGEAFTKDTDFWLDDARLGTKKVYLYDHGANDELKSQVIGVSTIEPRAEGLWYEAEVQKANKYASQIRALADAGVLGTSSGAIGHLTKRADTKSGATVITDWPIVEVSATVTPAEPRTLGVEAVKQLAEYSDSLKATLDAAARDDLSDSQFAFVDQQGDGHLPISDAGHTRAAMARFNQTQFPSQRVKRSAWRKIIAAASKFGIEMSNSAMPKSLCAVKAASFEAIRDSIREAISPDYDNDEPALIGPAQESDPTWIVATYPDHVIVCREDYDDDGDGGYWQIPYTVADDGTVTLGAAVQVEQTYTPVTKSHTPDIQITEAHEPATYAGDEAQMPLDKESQDAVVEGVAAKFAPQFDAIAKILERFENEPALKNAGFVTQDGGTADKNIKSFADYLMANRRDDVKRLTEVYGVKAVAQAEDSGTVGGYLVPTEYVAKLLQVAAEDSIVRPRAYIQPMVARELEIPALDQQTAPTAGNTSFYGGVQAVWTAEGGAYTQENTSFKLIRLVAHKLAGYTLASNELQADSAIALEALLTRLFGGAIGWYEDYAFLNGDGVAKPLGVTLAPCTIAVTRSSGGNDFDPADIGAMLKRLLPSSARSAVWVMHPFLLPSLLALSVGTSGFQTWVNNLRDSAPMTLLGLPVIFSEKMATSGTANDVMLADFRYYVIGDRQAINIASSEHYRFLNGQTTWRFEERVDGQPWLKSAITLSDASSTVSPFVTLS